MCDMKRLIKLCGYDTRLLGALQELQQFRESELSPAIKYINNTEGQQLAKVRSELKEIEDAISNINNPHIWSNDEKDLDHAAEEMVDTQTAIETLAVIMGISKERMIKARMAVKKRNWDRHYLTAPKMEHDPFKGTQF